MARQEAAIIRQSPTVQIFLQNSDRQQQISVRGDHDCLNFQFFFFNFTSRLSSDGGFSRHFSVFGQKKFWQEDFPTIQNLAA